ncbi:MAG: Trm112 family protein [Candidatus Natronoplasma sp.]
MKKSLLDILRCPECKGELELILPGSEDPVSKDEDVPEKIEEGTLHCESCEIDYPVEDGIPNMLPPEE